jgi:aminopeptidase
MGQFIEGTGGIGMKDVRIEELARNLINYSVELKPGEKILIENIGNEVPLTKALMQEAYKAGGIPYVTIKNNEILRVLLTECTELQLKEMASFEIARMKEMQAYIGLRAGENVSELGAVPPEKMSIYTKYYSKPLHSDLRVKHTKWCVMRYPNHSMAQLAGMQQIFLRIFISRCATWIIPGCQRPWTAW